MSTRETSVITVEGRTKKKLRKGAISCSECKRRKARCVFSSAADETCVGCERRGISCRSQEFDDDATVGEEGLTVRARLLKVETLLAKLLEKAQPEESGGKADGPIERGSKSPGPQNSAEGSTGILGLTEKISKGNQDLAQKTAPSTSRNEPPPISHRHGAGTDQDISDTLHAALPTQLVVDTLINGRSAVYLQILCNLYSDIFEGNVQPLSDLTTLPTRFSHPVLLARKLLQLAVCIQQLDPSFDDTSLALTEPLPKSMTKYVDLATTLVIAHDRFIDTLEGMECLILAGTWLINSGNLRRAWMWFRRTLNIAQLMGIHTTRPKRLEMLDIKTKVSCTAVWKQIFFGERYLSLLLGVPSAIPIDTFASEDNMHGASTTEGLQTIDRLQRVHGVICGMITQRNEAQAFQDFTTTSKIDFEVQRAVKNTDAKWWLLPSFDPAMSQLVLMEAVLRAHTHILFQHLLIMIHLPFMLRDASERIYDYSKTACVYASRETLIRWNSFRAFVRVVYCCRWLDHIAFTASLALLLAHLDSQNNSTGGDLQQRRLSDRALVEAAMETMDELNRVNGDHLTKETAEVTRKLLDMEADAFRRADNHTTRIKSFDHDDGVQDHAFELEIPYFGSVTIARQRRRPNQYPPTLNNQSLFQAANTQPWSSSCLPPAPVEAFNSLSGLESINESTWQLPVGQTRDSNFPSNGYLNPLLSLQDIAGGQNIIMTDLVAAEDDWTFQGVDAAFFDSVMKGTVTNSGDWGHNWSDWDPMH